MLWTAFMIGLGGSLHCVGMCGPIALALPQQAGNQWLAAANVLIYNLGRVFTYILLGFIIGTIGKGIFIAGIQGYFSIALGILLLLVALFSINIEKKILALYPIQRLQRWVGKNLGYLLKQNSRFGLFSIGVLNGLLPCGLVYMAIIGALTTGNIWSSGLYMGFFGAGTIPLMMATALAGQFITIKWRNRIRRLFPLFLIAFAILFLVRGINFIDALDWRMWQNTGDLPACH